MSALNDPPHDLRVWGVDVPTGTSSHIALPVVRLLDDSQIDLHIHVVSGANPGKTLAIICSTGEGGWTGLDPVLKLIGEISPADLAGNLLVVPVSDPVRLANANQHVYPGTGLETSPVGPAESAAATRLHILIDSEVLAQADGLVEIRAGFWGRASHIVSFPSTRSDPSASEQSSALAHAFGRSHIFSRAADEDGSAGALRLGVPAISVEIGGAGFDSSWELAWAADIRAGLLRVMASLGISSAGTPASTPIVVDASAVHAVAVRKAGMLQTELGPADLMTGVVQRDQVLGTLWDPYTFEIIEEVTAPVDGLLATISRPRPVHSGEHVFVIAEAPTRTSGEGLDAVPGRDAGYG